MKFFPKNYYIIHSKINNSISWLYNSLFLWNIKPFIYMFIYPTKNSLNILKLKFYTSFFSDFLIWNYLLNSSKNYKTTNIVTMNETYYSTQNNIYKTNTNTITSKIDLSNLFKIKNTFTYTIIFLVHKTFLQIQILVYKSFSFSWYYLTGFTFILFIDACLTDDEPLWEPIEWSLVQSWILWIFGFAWVAENLIVSRYGSYAGRDKRVWMAWYKTFWLIEGYYVFNYGVAAIIVMVPYYFEVNYNLSFIYSWWNWFSKAFFFKFTLLFTVILIIAFWIQINVRWVGFKKILFLVSLVNILLGYLIYTHFIIIFFGYFTDPIWYQRTRFIDYVQLSHEPAKWGWGPSKKDHFTYHGVKTVLWFKNDGPFATSFLFCQIFFFICLFCLFFYWIVLFRRIFSLSEVPLTYTTYCISSLKQFFFFFLYFYVFILLSFLSNYWRFPIEYFFTLDYQSWYNNFFNILWEYPNFLINLFL